MASAPTLERLYKLQELQDAGYGNRMTLLSLIHKGALPALKVGNAYKIRESDLHLIAEAVNDDARSAAQAAPADELSDIVRSVLDAYPRMSGEDKRAFSRFLTATA